jgi:hypothetical protein
MTRAGGVLGLTVTTITTTTTTITTTTISSSPPPPPPPPPLPPPTRIDFRAHVVLVVARLVTEVGWLFAVAQAARQRPGAPSPTPTDPGAP